MGQFFVVAQWYEQAEDGGHDVAEQQIGLGYPTYSLALAACKREQRDHPDGPYTFRVRERLPGRRACAAGGS